VGNDGKPPPAPRLVVTPRVGPHAPPVEPSARTVAAAAPGRPQLAPAGPQLAPGARIQQYELIRELGRGGMGVVWAARDLRLGRRVAIKFLLEASPEVAERFMIEARATARCTHEHIVIIHGVGEHAGMPYMVLEFLEGRPLRDRLDGGRRLPPSQVVEMMLPVARALERAHELGIVHRDLKPENVFVTSSGQIKVLDFGIAKAHARPDRTARAAPKAAVDPRLTAAGTLIGTLPYMPPEQLAADEIDHRTDLWACGIVMFEMLAGRHPVEPFTTDAIIAAVFAEEPLPSIAAVAPDAPAPLARLVDACLRKDKAQRPANAAELAERLAELLPGRRGGRALAEGESPFPGLSAFEEHDADRFFGRDREIARMVARVRELPMSLIVGPSGVGKSSFVRAGLVPALKASGERWELASLRPGRRPIAALASLVERLSLLATRPGRDEPVPDHAQLVERLVAEPGYLGALLRARVRDTGHNILLYVDQFEELYAMGADADERRAFTAALAGAADDTASPLRVVLSMRSDFVDRIAEDPRFAELASIGLVVLGPIERGGLRDALVRPVENVGYRFEAPAMIEAMLDELSETPSALPLLQFVADRLWDARDPAGKLLTEASYRASGGVTGALAAHADRVLEELSPAARALVPRIFRQLVTPERTRASAELADLELLAPDRGDVAPVIDRLVAARLLVVQPRDDSGGASVEIIHESLIERWPALRRWLEEDQEDAAFRAQLAAAAKQWEAKQRAQGLLWRGDAMDEARRWYGQRPRVLPARDQAFLDAVLALGRRGKRLRRAALAGAFAVLAAIAAGASFAYVRVHAAEGAAQQQAARASAALAREQDARAKEQAAASAARDAETRRDQALAQLLTAEQRAQAASNGLLSAQQLAQAAAAEKARAVQDLAAAQRAAEEQAQRAQQQSALVQLTREQLIAKNQELERALGAAKAATAQAQQAADAAKAAEARARAAEAQAVQRL
jgi:serine/threonine protein kinase